MGHAKDAEKPFRKGAARLSDHPKPANEYHLKTGQREPYPGH